MKLTAINIIHKGRWLCLPLIFGGLSLIPVALGKNKCDKYCILACPEFDGNGYNRSGFFECVDAQVDCNCLLQAGYRPSQDQEAAKNTKHAKRNFGRDNQPVLTFVLFAGAIFLIWVCRRRMCCRRSSSRESKTPQPCSVVPQPVTSTISGGGGGAHVVDTCRLSHGQSEPSITSPRRPILPSSVDIPTPMVAFQFPDPNQNVPPEYSPPPAYTSNSLDVVVMQSLKVSPACAAPEMTIVYKN